MKGFSLIEVMVSLFIISLMMVIFNTMMLYAIRDNKESYFRAVAQNQISNLIQELKTGKNSAEITQKWNQQNKILLPNGRGHISGNFPLYTITLLWSATLSPGNAKCLSIEVRF